MKKSPLFWIGLSILALVSVTIVLNVIGHFFHTLHYIQPHMGYGRGGGSHTFWFYGYLNNLNFLPFLFHIGLMMIGWWIWKKADGRTVKRWVGILLLTIGLFSILPLLLAVPILFIAVYFTTKNKKSTADYKYEPTIFTYSTYPSTNNILDEWERSTKKEENK
ncbi:hypothetical protein [Metabacillus litoralis]|uniref:hypothetical protein n=1 Tax=Metabacillus TaxID=2675233 RepID=UPI000EF5712B|nr:hypothetical protein [Metabacillus litoralis]MCM3161253.1 hypothetical protein [Metabacillus litoralis]